MINLDEIFDQILTISDNSVTENSITILAATTLSGKTLPLQVIYCGKEEKCSLPDFPKDWNITFTPSSKPNTKSLLEYLDEILLPYIKYIRGKLGCSDKQHAILILDKNGPHKSHKFLSYLHNANICEIFVPGGYTKYLQPIDVIGSTAEYIKSKLFENYSEKLFEPDVQLSELKEKHARWLIVAYEELENNPSINKHGWQETEISRSVLK